MEGVDTMVGDLTQDILEKLANVSYAEDGDYTGDEGLLYCGKCNTKKEREIVWPDKTIRKVGVMCRCREKENESTNARMQKEEEMRNLRLAKISSMMDNSFHYSTFDNYIKNKLNEKHWNNAMNYCREFKEMYEKNQGLLLYGSVGTGKSYTAACIANYLLDHNVSVVMTSFVRILQEMQGFDREKEEAFSSKLSSVKLLVIDDLGAERNTDYALEKVYGIVDNRYRAKKPLILTTNLTLEQMQAVNDIRYERIYDRIFEMCFPIEFTGISWRKREAAQRYEETKKLLEG